MRSHRVKQWVSASNACRVDTRQWLELWKQSPDASTGRINCGRHHRDYGTEAHTVIACDGRPFIERGRRLVLVKRIIRVYVARIGAELRICTLALVEEESRIAFLFLLVLVITSSSNISFTVMQQSYPLTR